MHLSTGQKDAIVAAHKALLQQLSSIYVINQALPDALMGRTSISTVSSASPPTLVSPSQRMATPRYWCTHKCWYPFVIRCTLVIHCQQAVAMSEGSSEVARKRSQQ